MFRFTIYSIVAYAFWLTFIDVSNYFEQSTGSSWLSDLKSSWVDENDDSAPKQDFSQLNATLTTDNCEMNHNCYAQQVPMGE
ncbi:hypothetical protein [Shewanella psychrotolerans]|uniref:hypothetical protein n=1 Tax=Shewanella psychrotolerans TaxID=2864206 RepID=UPI001C658B87|nr:hypothetical protein [Shewanella psychrotolerans]QYK02970.1 hypothetical protein K0I62_08610 [Shewanella psychrotolerans]